MGKILVNIVEFPLSCCLQSPMLTIQVSSGVNPKDRSSRQKVQQAIAFSDELKCFQSSSLIGQLLPEVPVVVRKIPE